MNQEKSWLLTEKYHDQKTDGFLADCARLDTGEPLAYIIGHIPFLGCTIYLDSQPLIPRPETEYWVEQVITTIETRRAKGNPSSAVATPRVLDLCAGSGCVGVAVARALPAAQVDFAEIDPTHLATIQKNLQTNVVSSRRGLELEARYQVYQSDLFAGLPKAGTRTTKSSRPRLELGRYDYILSNPPYIDPARDRTEASVTAYEPYQALYGGTDGFALIARIIAAAPAYLAAQGELWIEHEPEQHSQIHQTAKQHGFSSTTHLDQYGVKRYSRLVLQ